MHRAKLEAQLPRIPDNYDIRHLYPAALSCCQIVLTKKANLEATAVGISWFQLFLSLYDVDHLVMCQHLDPNS